MRLVLVLPAVIAVFLALTPTVYAQGGCGAEVAQFRKVIDSDAETGNVAKSVYARIQPELVRIAETCRAGRDAEALRALQALKRRHGYY